VRDYYDRSSKWMISHHGDSLLRLGGATDIASWRALPADLVQPRQLPDGLLEVRVQGRPEPDLHLIEIATYPETRVTEQVVRDAMAVYLDRHVLPEVLTLVLHPKGQVRVSGAEELTSRRGWTRLACAWRVVELWTLPATSLLAMDDVGVLPWVPLAQSDQPPEVLLRACRERIDRLAAPEEHANLLAVAQVLARLRYNDPGLLSIFGGSQAMIESPLIQELMAQRGHKDIVRVLAARFGSVPPEIEAAVRAIQDESRLDALLDGAALCPDLEAFRQRLAS
jgi:hypothetical protein